MIVLPILLTIVCILLLHRIKKYNKYKKLVNAFPGRKGHFLLGDIIYFGQTHDEIFKTNREYSEQFPNGYRIWAGNIAIININTPEHAKFILSTNKNNQKSQFYKFLNSWLKDGILTTKGGDKWQKRRKILTPGFHFNNLSKFHDIFLTHSNKLIDNLKPECLKDKTNIVNIFNQFSLNLLLRTTFGVDINENEKNKIYLNSIKEFEHVANKRFVTPLYYFDVLFKLTSLGEHEKNIVDNLNNFTDDIIKNKIDSFDGSSFKEKMVLSLLDYLLMAYNKNDIDKSGIKEELDTLIFEGHDTVNKTIACFLMLIANNKTHQDKIISEMNEIFGDSNRHLTREDLQKMEHLERCIKECLRLYPVAPTISRVATEDIQLDENHIIPKDCIINIHIFDIHRNEKHFPNPNKFNPDRFLPENTVNKHPYSFLAFSAGPRNCIGQKFAMLLLKSVIISILRNYEVLPITKPESLTLGIGLVIKFKEPIYVKFLKRNT